MGDLHVLGDRINDLWEPLGTNAALHLGRSTMAASAAIGRHDNDRFEVGSCFKAFVAAECCQQVSEGLLSWEEPIRLDPGLRVPASARSDQWPDGSTRTLNEVAEAMIAVSDNTATDMVLDRIGHAPVADLIGRLGLADTVIPQRVRTVYAQDPGVRPIACGSTMRDLARFYAAVLSPDSILDERARSDFRRLLRQEDLEQGSTWPDGVICYRKSGALEPPPMFAMAMAGAFATKHHRAEFAFALNTETSDVTAMAEAASVFIEGVTLGMKALAASKS